MFVEKWMTPNPFTLPPDTTISAAAAEMRQHHFRHLLVTESNPTGKRLLGLLAKDNIARAFPSDYNPFSPQPIEKLVSQPISTIMIHNVATVEPYCAIEEAVHVLRTRRINALPVVRNGNLVGIITETDIYDALLDMTGTNAAGVKLIVESDDVKNALLSMGQLCDRYQLHLLNALSFRDKLSPNKVVSAFHFAGKTNSHFADDLHKHGFRVLKNRLSVRPTERILSRYLTRTETLIVIEVLQLPILIIRSIRPARSRSQRHVCRKMDDAQPGDTRAEHDDFSGGFGDEPP